MPTDFPLPYYFEGNHSHHIILSVIFLYASAQDKGSKNKTMISLSVTLKNNYSGFLVSSSTYSGFQLSYESYKHVFLFTF